MAGKAFNNNPSLIGKVYNRLTITGFSYNTPTQAWYWKCLCICGKEIASPPASVMRGKTKSCGCYIKEILKTIGSSSKNPKTKHRMTNTVEYAIWMGINSRCNNPNRGAYKKYGGRGIKICERWNDYRNFISDMGPRPSKDHSIG